MYCVRYRAVTSLYVAAPCISSPYDTSPDVISCRFMSPYGSSLNEPQSRELHQPWIG
jgi:hypothetical protein